MEHHVSTLNCGRYAVLAANIFNRGFKRFNIFKVKHDGVSLFTGLVVKPYTKSVEWRKELMNMLADPDEVIKFKEFLQRTHGVFSGLIFNPKERVIHAFVDHISSKSLYYYVDDDLIVISSEYSLIPHTLTGLGKRIHLDLREAYFLLSFGYMIRDVTIIEDVHKVMPGTILRIDTADKTLNTISYYRVDK
ncbi:MAG: hypothetical protein B6U73_05285 [Desulfurococcales archaeon ex4484_204]|nr:MAG: hypothetical protein B6U73_05285 [Desulfurococcales archaeon ex4484_204]